MHPALIAVIGVIGAFIVFQILARVIRKAHPFPIPASATRILDNPFRRRFLSASKTVQQIGVREDMKVLELGPGGGFLTGEASRRVGDGGGLYCLDIAPVLIAKLKKRTAKAGLENVALVVGDGQRLPFKDGSFDLAFLAGVLGEIPDKDLALRELHRVLNPAGVLSISELLPDPDYPLRRTTIAWAGKAGFEPFQQFGNFFTYTVNFKKRGDPC